MATLTLEKPGATRVGHARWLVCLLLFLAATVNYVDRNSLSVLKTTLQQALGWNDADYGWVTFGFTAAYALVPVLAGRMVDRLGVKRALALGVTLWSLACIGHGLVRTVLAFAVMRFLLGSAESVNFPAAVKAIGQWFPQKERTFATGLFNSGTNVGVMLSFGVVWLATLFGWPWAFIATGAIGLLWLGLWGAFYTSPDDSRRLGAAELRYIRADQPPPGEREQVHWIRLLRCREVWPYLLAKFLTDPVWWFYLFWLPSYLERERGLNPLNSALVLIIIYTGATVGSVSGGWLSGWLMGRGWRVGPARRMAMLIPAAFMPLAIAAYYTHSIALCLALITLATGLHQAWSATVLTMPTDLFPDRVAGAVAGLGTTAGGIGGMFLTLLVGAVVQWLGRQQVVFIWAGLMHPLSWILVLLMLGRNWNVVRLDRPLDLSRPNRPLQVGGLAGTGLGLAAAALIAFNWSACVTAAHSASAAAAALTAAAGVTVIGFFVLFAGNGHKALARRGA